MPDLQDNLVSFSDFTNKGSTVFICKILPLSILLLSRRQNLLAILLFTNVLVTSLLRYSSAHWKVIAQAGYELQLFLEEHGIKHQFSVPYEHHQNRVERLIQHNVRGISSLILAVCSKALRESEPFCANK